MVFGDSSSEKKFGDLSEKFEELKSQRRLAELDTEKRMLLLESSVASLQKIFNSMKDFETAKDLVSNTTELQGKLREIEDISLITRLESVQSDDKLTVIDENIAQLKEKISLLSDAVDVLGGTKLSSGAGARFNPEEIESLKSEVAAIKAAISKLASNTIPPQKFSELEAQISGEKNTILSLGNDLQELTSAVREKIEILERNIGRQSIAGIPEELLQNIGEMQRQIEQLKAIDSKVIKQLENDSRKIKEIKSLPQDSKDSAVIQERLAGIEKTIQGMKKEMDLDRTMYPENMMKLERELAELKKPKKDAELLSSVQKLADEMIALSSEVKNAKEKLSGYGNTMDSLLENNDSLKAGISDTITTIKNVMSESAELKKSVSLLQEKISENQDAPNAGQDSELLEGFGKKIRHLEDTHKALISTSHEKLMDEVRLLRREIANIKEKLSEQSVPVPSSHAAEGTSPGLIGRIDDLERVVLVMKKEIDLDRAMNPNTLIKTGNVPVAVKNEQNAEFSAKGAEDMKTLLSQVRSLDAELSEFKSIIRNLVSISEQTAENLRQVCREMAEMRHKQPIIID